MRTTTYINYLTLPLKKPSCSIVFVLIAFLSFVPVLGDELQKQNSQSEAAIETRLKQSVEYLASDELQGRAPGTEGIDKAADYIAKRMAKTGLKTGLLNGSSYQMFYFRIMNYEDEQRFSLPGMFRYVADRLSDSLLKPDPPPNPPVKNESPGNATKPVNAPTRMKNVVAMLEGVGPKAEETLVIGAHYDHLGMRKTSNGQMLVFHGANDNASGVAVMLEVAEMLAHRQKKLPRRIVFVAFSGEESGLLGSFYYVNHPAVPLAKTIAMINLDVVGRMQSDVVVTIGTSTSPMLAKMTDKAVEQHKLTLLEFPSVVAGSDHMPFYSQRIPVVFLLTHGGRGDYHRPSDMADTLNYPGMRKIAQITADLAVDLAEADRRPQFSEESVIAILLRNALRMWAWLFN